MHVYVHPYEVQKSMLGVLNHFLLYFVRQYPSLNLELTALGRLTGQQAPRGLPVSASQAQELQEHITVPSFLCEGDPHSGLRVYIASTFMGKPSFASPTLVDICCIQKTDLSVCLQTTAHHRPSACLWTVIN